MPWYRKNSSTAGGGTANNWVTIANVYRKNSDGPWVKLRRIYRKNSDGAGGNWVIVHDSDSLKPFYTVPPTLESNAYSPSVFSNGSTITLTRGTWSNTGTSFAPVSYLLEIQYSTDNINWYTQTSGTGTSISYTISLVDARSPSTYFRGKVTATNVNGSTFAIVGTTRSNIDMIVSSVNASTAGNDISISWVTDPSNTASNISSQLVEVKTNVAYTYNGQSFSAYQTVHSYTVPPGTNFSLLSIAGTNIRPSTSIYVQVTVTANDSAGTQDSNYSLDFISPILVGTVDISPSFSVLNGYRRVEAGSTVTAVPSGWPSGTTFTYEWYRSRSFQPADDLFIGSGSSITVPSSSFITGERIWVNIYGTYEGQTSSAVFSTQHRIIPAPPSFTLGGGSSAITITSLTATGGEFYFGTYNGPTSGTIPQTAIGTDYSITGLSSGEYTVTLFSRAINGNTGFEVTTESNSSTSVVKSVTVLSPPTPTSAFFSNGTFYIYFSGGSGPYYQVYWNTSTNPAVNNPNTLGVTDYDFNASSSPATWTPLSASGGVTYNFWVRSSLSLTTTTPGEYSTWSNSYVQATPPVATAPTSVTASNNGSNNTITVSWSGATNANYYRIYWNANGIVPGSATTYYDEEKSGATTSWAWGPGDPDRNGLTPSQGGNYYFMVAASYDNVTWSSYTVTSSATALAGPPSGGSVTLSGGSQTQSTITATSSGWSGSPTSYYTEIRTSTGVSVSQTDSLVASSNSNSVSYVIPYSAGISPVNLYRAFAYASNANGQSSTVSSNTITTTQSTVPGTVTSLTCSSLLSSTNLNWSASWSAPSNNGGQPISGYDVYVQRATSSSGPWVAATTQIPAGSGAYTSTSPYSTSSTSVSGRITGSSTYTWVRVFVRAKNAVGAGSYTTAVG